ncbi:hypothetical protein GMRT_10768 [Giardia muris]|uniref:Uncharacterized protein n=1 Tax=Giardia muris TaxID=5742 RepID=A0A4Z1SY65_GIAMU|nr:hypothetical protein GMRT_10768 [Giardia muris]|eukprot:TNJ30644.1 hypothetical protein GMRT_10768 [Giardia muris]
MNLGNAAYGDIPTVIYLIHEVHRVFLNTQRRHRAGEIGTFQALTAIFEEYYSVFIAIQDQSLNNPKLARDVLFLEHAWRLLEALYLSPRQSGSDVSQIPGRIAQTLSSLLRKLKPDVESFSPEQKFCWDLILDNTEEVQAYLQQNIGRPYARELINHLNNLPAGMCKLGQVGVTDEFSLERVLKFLRGDPSPELVLGYLPTKHLGNLSGEKLSKVRAFVKATNLKENSFCLTDDLLLYLMLICVLRLRHFRINDERKQGEYSTAMNALFEVAANSNYIPSHYGNYCSYFLHVLKEVLQLSELSFVIARQKEGRLTTTKFLMDDVFLKAARGNFLWAMIYAHILDLIAYTGDSLQLMEKRGRELLIYADLLSSSRIQLVLSNARHEQLQINTHTTNLWSLSLDYYHWSLPRKPSTEALAAVANSMQQVIREQLQSRSPMSHMVRLLYLISSDRLGEGVQLEGRIRKYIAQALESYALVQDAAIWYHKANYKGELQRLVFRTTREAIRLALNPEYSDQAAALFSAVETMLTDVDSIDPEVLDDLTLAKNVRLFREKVTEAQRSCDDFTRCSKDIQELAHELVSSPAFFLNVTPNVVGDACRGNAPCHLTASQLTEMAIAFQKATTHCYATQFLPQNRGGRLEVGSTEYDICAKLADAFMSPDDVN